MMTKSLTYSAIGLALALLAQSLRLFLPLPPGVVSQLLIGSLVNLSLVLTVRLSHAPKAAAIGFILSAAAFLQGQLPLLPLVPVVGLGNAVFAWLAGARLWDSRLIWSAPMVKAALLYGGTQCVLCIVELPDAVSAALSLAMGLPQVVTGAVGIALAKSIVRRVDQAP